jgi:hypothetical protein
MYIKSNAMTKNERSHQAMLDTSEELIVQNADKFLPSSAYEEALENLLSGNKMLKNLAKAQDELQHASVAPKNAAREAASMPIFQLANIIGSMAYATGNILLAEKVEITFTDLKRMSNGELVNRFSTILNAGAENLPALITYGVTQEILTANTALLSTYEAEIKKQAQRILDLKEVTKQIKKQFKACDSLLKPFDKMVEASRVSDPVWYSLYQSARTIKYSSGSHVSVKAKVFDAETNQPLQGAIIEYSKIENGKALTSGADLVKVVKVKSAGGGVDLKSFATGAYLFTVSYAGRADQQTTVYVNEGVLTRVDFPLSKIA